MTSRPSCRRIEFRRRRRLKKHIWAARETCSRIDICSESNSTSRFRTQLVGLITLRPTVMALVFGGRRRSSDVEPNHSNCNSVLCAFSWSLFAAHQTSPRHQQRSTPDVSPSRQRHVVCHRNSSAYRRQIDDYAGYGGHVYSAVRHSIPAHLDLTDSNHLLVEVRGWKAAVLSMTYC